MGDISPNVVIMTREELDERMQRQYIRGVERGKFEVPSSSSDALEILEQGCSLFWGRHPDMSHMDNDEFRQAHLRWYERASQFLRKSKKADIPLSALEVPSDE